MERGWRVTETGRRNEKKWEGENMGEREREREGGRENVE